MGVGGTPLSFLTSALDRGGWSASRTGRSTPAIHCIGDGVDPRAGLDTVVRERKYIVPGFKVLRTATAES
jgi:hypothetical protein